MNKYKLNQEVFYMMYNKIHSGQIESIKIVYGKYDPWGRERVEYYVSRSIFLEEDLFASKEDLIKTL